MSTLSFHADSELEKRIRATARKRKLPLSRFLKESVEQSLTAPARPDIRELLERLHAADKGVNAKRAETFLKQNERDRKAWRGA